MSHVLTASGPHHDNLEQTTTQTWWNLFPDHWFWSNPGEKTQEPTPATKGKECHAKRVLWLGAEWPETRAARSANSKWNGGWMCGICHCCSLPHAPSGKSKVLGSLSRTVRVAAIEQLSTLSMFHGGVLPAWRGWVWESLCRACVWVFLFSCWEAV